jgi:hypothetical protein
LGFTTNGKASAAFRSGKTILVQFGDLSLHHIVSGDTPPFKWVREEGLSRVKQVEIINRDSVRIETELEYVKSVNKKISIAEAPTRILNRYKENFNYLVKHI